MAFELRDYQRAAIDALFTYWCDNGGNGLIVLPTGSGKSLVIAALCQEILRDYPTMRIGIITHVRELIAQDYRELIALWPEAEAGIYSAGMRRRDTKHRILFLGIQSVYQRSDLGFFDLLLVDEAHLVSHDESTMYRKFFERQREGMPDLRIAGLTATAFRLDTGRLDAGFGKIFDRIVHQANVRDLIEAGWLCKLISKATKQKLDVSKVGKRGGEFINSELAAAVDQEDVTQAAAEETVALAGDRKCWLVFCVNIAHAEHVCDALCELGVNAEAIFGHTPKAIRDDTIERFRDGKITALVSVMVLGTGFNVPQIDLIVLLRPTASAGLFSQQVGRGLRQAPGKENCLVLDFAGNTRRHGPIDMVGSDKIAEAMECPECASLVITTAKKCPDCGYVFPVEEKSEEELAKPKQKTLHEAEADQETDIVSSTAPKWVVVTGVRYAVHHKYGDPSATPTMRVEYQCGRFSRYPEWICLEHFPGSYPYEKAKQWWLQHAIDPQYVPVNIEQAVQLARNGCLRAPSEILVRSDGKFFKIAARRFPTADPTATARTA